MDEEETTTMVVHKSKTTTITKQKSSRTGKNTKSVVETTITFGNNSLDLQQDPEIIRLLLDSKAIVMEMDSNATQALVSRNANGTKVSQIWAQAAQQALGLQLVLDATTYMMACAMHQNMKFTNCMPEDCTKVLKSYLKDQFEPYKNSLRDTETRKLTSSLPGTEREAIERNLATALKKIDRSVDKCVHKIESLIFLWTSPQAPQDETGIFQYVPVEYYSDKVVVENALTISEAMKQASAAFRKHTERLKQLGNSKSTPIQHQETLLLKDKPTTRSRSERDRQHQETLLLKDKPTPRSRSGSERDRQRPDFLTYDDHESPKIRSRPSKPKSQLISAESLATESDTEEQRPDNSKIKRRQSKQISTESDAEGSEDEKRPDNSTSKRKQKVNQEPPRKRGRTSTVLRDDDDDNDEDDDNDDGDEKMFLVTRSTSRHDEVRTSRHDEVDFAKSDDDDEECDVEAAKRDDDDEESDVEAAKSDDDDEESDVEAAKRDDDEESDVEAAKRDDDEECDVEAAKSDDEDEESDVEAAKRDDDEECDVEAANSDDGGSDSDCLSEAKLRNSKGEEISVWFTDKTTIDNPDEWHPWDSEKAWNTEKDVYQEVPMLSIDSKATEFAEAAIMTDGDLLSLELFTAVVYRTEMQGPLFVRWDRLIGLPKLRLHYEAAKIATEKATKEYSLFCACFSTMINQGASFDPCSDPNDFANMRRFIEVIKKKESTNLGQEFEAYLSTLCRVFLESKTMPRDAGWTEEYTFDSHAICILHLAKLFDALQMFSIWTVDSDHGSKYKPIHFGYGYDTILPASLEQWSALICDRPYIVIEKGERIHIRLERLMKSFTYSDHVLYKGDRFLVFGTEEQLKGRLEECCQKLAECIGRYFHGAFSQVLGDISCSNESKQSYLMSYYTDSNAFIRHAFYRSLKTLVRCALDHDDPKSREMNKSDEDHKSYLDGLYNAFVLAMENTEKIVFPGMFKGPIILESWLNIPSDPSLEARLSCSLQRQFDSRKDGKRWLSKFLDSINVIFMTSCFGVQKRDDGDYGFFLLPYITIRPPFYLPYSGIIRSQKKDRILFVEPCSGVFIVPDDNETENFFRFLKHQGQGPPEFIVSRDRPGLVNLVETLSSSADLLELHCLKNSFGWKPAEPSSNQPILAPQISGSVSKSQQWLIQNRQLDYIDSSESQSKKIRKDINENGYSCVEFLPSFRERALSMLEGKSIHDLAYNALTLARKIDGTKARYHYKYEQLFARIVNAKGEQEENSHGLLRKFIDGLLKVACSQLKECIEIPSNIRLKHSLIWKEGTVGLLSGPKEKEQKPHLDCFPQLNDIEEFCPLDCDSTLTVVVNCSDDDQTIIVWPKSFEQIRLNQMLKESEAPRCHQAQAMSWFKSKKIHLEIPKYGCVVFPSDTLHAGAENPTDTHLFRGFCVLQRNAFCDRRDDIPIHTDDIHHICDTNLQMTMEGLDK